MKKYMRLQAGLLLAAIMGIFFTSCQKNQNSNSAIPPNKNQLDIRMTDDPGFFDAVYIDLQGVAVKVDTSAPMADTSDHHPDHFDWDGCFRDREDGSNAVWDTIAITPGLYDLSQLSNGADTLLSSGIIPKGKILAIRLTLGTGSYLVKDSVDYPLNLWNGMTNVYVRIYGDQIQKLSSGKYRLWIDFDAGHSVLMVRQGTFYLKPFIRAFVVSIAGSVQGNVLPHDAFPVVSLYNSTDTLYALPRMDGFFMIPGVDTGTYTLFVNASNGYNDTTINDVHVSEGQKTDIGVIHLSKQ